MQTTPGGADTLPQRHALCRADSSRLNCGAAAIAVLSVLAALVAVAAQAAPPSAPHFEAPTKADDSDFAFANGYDATAFAATMPVRCPRTPRGAVAASFEITLRKPAPGVRDAQALRLGFWDRGIEHFGMRIWSSHEPVGALKTLRFDLAALPPVGGAVLRNSGHGLRLLRDRDFSFSVSDRAAVIQATLSYRCGDGAFGFAMVEPTSAIEGDRSGDAWRSVPPTLVRPPVPKQRDADPGRLSIGVDLSEQGSQAVRPRWQG